MLKVAITGNIASGKSVVEELLKEKGFKVLDCDIIAHELLIQEEVAKKIIKTFKNFDIIEENKISRRKLAQVVFEDKTERKKLENIIHPLIKEEIGRFFRSNKDEKIAFVSIPLLFEAKFENLFDKIILIHADDDIRLQRLLKRNDLTLKQAKNRIDIQLSQDKKIPLSDYVIYNNESKEKLSEDITKILNLL